MEHLVIRIPLPPEMSLRDRSKLIVDVEPAVEILSAVSGHPVEPVIEAEPRKRAPRSTSWAVHVEGQTDLEDAIREAMASAMPTEFGVEYAPTIQNPPEVETHTDTLAITTPKSNHRRAAAQAAS